MKIARMIFKTLFIIFIIMVSCFWTLLLIHAFLKCIKPL